MENLIGKVLASRYEILEKIGEGGMAIVYKARCKLLNRFVAVKVLKEEYAKDEVFVARFRAEAQSAAALTHPNIVSVYDVGQEDGGKINYIVMELLEATTLKDYINEHGALSSEMTLKISAQIASALDCAHKAHIIHRDIKPQNIVLNKNMVAKVTDFGIAKVSTTTGATITNFGSTMGSVHYFSPEHAKGGYTDEKSDIYSLGIVMYEMATGKVPFDGDSPVSVALKQIQEEAVEPIKLNPAISMSLNEIIKKAMQKNTALRYQNANEILIDISRALANPNAILKRQETYIEAGETQVIPTLGDVRDDLQVPNIRTRQANKQNISGQIKPVHPRTQVKLNVEEQNETKQDEKEQKSNKKSNKAKFWIIIGVLITILAIMGTVFIVKMVKKINSQNEGTQITVPDLKGKKYEDFVELYKNMGIELIQDEFKYNNDYEEGYVVSQKPEAGTVTKDNRVYLVISKGKKMVDVTDVVGKDIKVARYELEQTLGFVVEVEEVVDEKISAGIVKTQSVNAGEQAAYGSTIKLQVSKGDGKATVTMPSVLNETEADAKAKLEGLKLTVNVKYDSDDTKKNGVVIKQSYPQNQSLKEGDLVEITVNKLQLSKKVSIKLSDLISEEDIKEEIKLYVTASVDGGAANNVFGPQTYTKVADTTIEFTVNGYTSAVLKIYIDDKQVKEQVVTF